MRKSTAFTLLEILMAMGLLSILMGFAYKAINDSLRDQSVQEATTNTQAKLRRIVEVMTQDIRSAVLGGIINTPYGSGSTAISFALLDGGAGFPLSGSTATGTTVISTASSVTALGIAQNDILFLLDTVNNRGILRTVSATPVSAGGNQYTVSYANCPNAAGTAMAFKVSPQGYTYDSSSKQLRYTRGSLAQEVVAFNITNLQIAYVYRNPNNNEETNNPTGYISGGSVQQMMTIGGNPFYLQRIQLTLASDEKAGGRTITRSYTGQIELLGTDQKLSANNQPFRGVVACS